MARYTVTVAIFYLVSMAVLVSFNVIGAGAADVTEQAKLRPADLMRTFGYNVEVHKVITEDGYILEVDRIPHSPTSSGKNQRPAVLLVHGILANAVSWVANLPSQSPGFLLSDAGFDVWFINCRGVPESNFHQTLTTKDPKFWKWTFDEIGRYDLSAVIDYILKETQLPNISLLTTSRGFTSSAVLLSLRPEYNDKVNLLIGYAPVVNITHFTSPLRFVIPFAGPVKAINDFLTRGGFLVQSQTQKNLIATVCNSPLRDACYAPLATMFGINPKQLNKTRIPVYVANNPVGTSSQELVHYAQVYNAKNFIRYDYGKEENQERYGQIWPILLLPIVNASANFPGNANAAVNVTERQVPRLLNLPWILDSRPPTARGADCAHASASLPLGAYIRHIVEQLLHCAQRHRNNVVTQSVLAFSGSEQTL